MNDAFFGQIDHTLDELLDKLECIAKIENLQKARAFIILKSARVQRGNAKNMSYENQNLRLPAL